MIRVCDLSMPLDYTEKDLREAAAKALNIPLNEIKAFSLARRSIDARKRTKCILSAPSTYLSPERKRPF